MDKFSELMSQVSELQQLSEGLEENFDRVQAEYGVPSDELEPIVTKDDLFEAVKGLSFDV